MRTDRFFAFGRLCTMPLVSCRGNLLNMRIPRCLLLSTLCLLSACAGKSHVDNVSHKITYSLECQDAARLIERIDTLEYVALKAESSDELFQQLDKMFVMEDGYIVVDFYANAVNCYSRSGNQLYRIHSRGRGPSEYVEMSDAVMAGDRLCILDAPSSKVLVYNAKTGAFVKRIELDRPVVGQKFEIENDRIIIFNENCFDAEGDKNISLFTADGKHIGDSMPIADWSRNLTYSLRSTFVRTPRELLLVNALDSRIYRFDNDRFTEACTIDYNGEGIPSSLLDEMGRGDDRERMKAIESVMEDGHYVYGFDDLTCCAGRLFGMFYGKGSVLAVTDTDSWQTECFDLRSLPVELRNIRASDSAGNLYSVIYYPQIRALYNGAELNSLNSKAVYDYYRDIENELVNPLIVRIKLQDKE